MVESDNIVQESAPFVRIGIAAALLELLFPICERFLWYLIQNSAKIAKTTPITTPMEIPIINPDDSPFISSSVLQYSLLNCPILQPTCILAQQCFNKTKSKKKIEPLEILYYYSIHEAKN